MGSFVSWIVSLFLAAWGRLIMQWSVSFVVDLAKVALIVLVLAFGFYLVDHQAKQFPPLIPKRDPQDEAKSPKKPRRILPLRSDWSDLAGDIVLGGPQPPDGSSVQIDYPLSEDMRNIGSKVDGAGMCVMTSAERAAIWAGIDSLRGLRNWCAREPGGCDPDQFDDQLRRFCKSKGMPVPDYLQYQGKDPEFLRLVLKTRRMPGVTYSGADGVQYRRRIAHMLNLVHLADDQVGVFDNNFDAEKRIWMSEQEFFSRAVFGRSRNFWAIVWLAPGASPPVVR